MKNRITCESFNVSWDRNGTGAGFKASCTAARSAAAARRSKPRAPSGRRPQHAARARRPIISFQMRRSLPVLERPAHRRGLARAKAASPRGRPAFHVEPRPADAGGSELSPRPWEHKAHKRPGRQSPARHQAFGAWDSGRCLCLRQGDAR